MVLSARIWLLCLALLSISALGQTASDRFVISGTVSDPSGAGIPGVQVTLQKSGGARLRVTTTDISGAFRFAAATSGSFEIVTNKEGFGSETVPVRISDRPQAPLQITLRLADVHAQVTVTESAAQ